MNPEPLHHVSRCMVQYSGVATTDLNQNQKPIENRSYVAPNYIH